MKSIWEQAEALSPQIIAQRRDLHKFPETGWTEFRTACIVIKKLRQLGYIVHFGADVIDGSAMMGVPSEVSLRKYMQRALNEGANAELVEKMQGGKTGIVAVLDSGKVGKTIAFRFDMDANDLDEAQDDKHLPYQEGFASCHEHAMHGCGHDGHVAIGLAVAELLAKHKDELIGKVKLIFQPAEEGVRGAYAMVKAGVVDDVDYFFSGHLGFAACEDDLLVTMTDGFFATTKMDAAFTGVAAHAGAAPEEGKNALLAAAQAAISLNTIARHSDGASRINVGVLHAGTGRNVVADKAFMQLETRGATTKVDDFMTQEAVRMLQASAALYDVDVELTTTGAASVCKADKAMAHELAVLAEQKCRYGKILEHADIGCSEDCAYFIDRVQERGGRAVYMMYGTEIAASHHNNYFNFHEDCLWKAAAFLAETAIYFSHK